MEIHHVVSDYIGLSNTIMMIIIIITVITVIIILLLEAVVLNACRIIRNVLVGQ